MPPSRFLFSLASRLERVTLPRVPLYADTDPHTAIVLLGPDGSEECLSVWRDDPSAAGMETGELLPLPDAAVEAAGDNIEPAGIVAGVHRPDHLPDELRAALPEKPAPGCCRVIAVRVLLPEITDDGFVSLGAFDPSDARQILTLLEEHEVPFEIEADHSALTQAGREVSMYLAMYPRGSQLHIVVDAGHLGHARRILRYLYPPEKPPPSFRAVGSLPGSPPKPAMEVYTAPSTEIRVHQQPRDFYAPPPEDPGKAGKR